MRIRGSGEAENWLFIAIILEQITWENSRRRVVEVDAEIRALRLA